MISSSQARSTGGIPPTDRCSVPRRTSSGRARSGRRSFRKPLSSPALRIVLRATQASHQLLMLVPEPSPNTGSSSRARMRSRARFTRTAPPIFFSFSLTKRTPLMPAARSMSAVSWTISSSITGTAEAAAASALAAQSSMEQGCSNSSIPSGRRLLPKRTASAVEKAWLASSRSTACPATSFWMKRTRARSWPTSKPTLTFSVRQPSARAPAFISAASGASSCSCSGARSGIAAGSETSSTGSRRSSSRAVTSVEPACSRPAIAASSTGCASSASSPISLGATSARNAQPPSAVSCVRPGVIPASPQPLRPSTSTISATSGRKTS